MKYFVLSGLVLAAVTMNTGECSAMAEPVTSAVDVYNFKVAPGRLPDVIAEIAAQSRATIQVDASGDAGNAKGVQGAYTLQQALERALDGTSWQVTTDETGAIRLTRDGNTTVVISARRKDFVETSSSMLTRTDTPLRQTPGTVDTVTKEVLESQNALTFAEVVRNIPGVTYKLQGIASQPSIGQDSSGGDTYTNGMRNSSLSQNGSVVNIEAVEVLKGPASILVGTGIAGGVINFVPKRANGRKETFLTVGAGSGNEWLASVDTGGALSEEKGLFWRFVGLTEHADTLPQGRGRSPDQQVLTPMFGYRGDTMKLDLTLQYEKKNTPFLPVAEYFHATNTFVDYGNLVDDRAGTNVESKKASFDFEKTIVSSDALTLKARARGQYEEAQNLVRTYQPYTMDYLGMGMLVSSLAEDIRDKGQGFYGDLYFKFNTGPVAHQVIAAFDYSKFNYSFSFNSSGGFGQVELAEVVSSPRYTMDTEQKGYILQDQITYGKWHGLLGVRATDYTQSAATPSGYVYMSYRKSQTLPNAGIVYDFTSNISGYVSYSSAFDPHSASMQAFDGSLLPAHIRTQYETGIKAGFFKDRVTVNASLYNFETNVSLLSDYEHPGYYKEGGGTVGSGGEISIAGSITPTLKLISGYQKSSAEYNDGTGIMLPVRAAPEHTFNLWALKSFSVGNDRKLEVGFGGNYYSGFWATDILDSDYPAYEIKHAYISVNGSVAYTVGRIKINAMFNNLFDRRNYMPSDGVGALSYDVPRSVRVNLTTKF
jgi:outer membrane receptor protein involved in Fe transport